MSKIAQVAVKMIVDGETKIFQPGEVLPELSRHDEKELLRSKSIVDPADLADDEEDEAGRQQRAQARFDAAKREVQEAFASTSSGEQTSTASGAPATEAASAPASTAEQTTAPATEGASTSTSAPATAPAPASEQAAAPAVAAEPAPAPESAPAPAPAPTSSRKR